MGISRRAFVIGAAAVGAACGGDTARPAVDAGTTAPETDARAAETGSESTTPPESPAEDPGDGPVGAFGASVDLGPVDELAAAVAAEQGFLSVPHARAWVTRIEAELLADVEAAHGSVAAAGVVEGFVALYQKCPHLGCRVPECRSAGRFECPCHGSIFTRLGEWVGGPAPRGMDRFPLRIVDGRVLADTSTVLEGPDRGVRALSDEATGAACIQA